MIAASAKRTIRRGLGLLAPAVWSLRPNPSLAILTYHRVLPKDHPDRQFEQPGMCVTPTTLEMHLRALKKHFEIVDLGDWVRRSEEGASLPHRACAITFDDGWRDNYDFGLPVLLREKVPATIFLVADYVGGNYEFWPSRLSRILLRSNRQDHVLLRTRVKDRLAVLRVPVPEEGIPLTFQQVDQIIAACKQFPDHAIEQLLAEAELDPPKTPRSLVNRVEVLEMRQRGLVSIGSHGRRHLRLRGDLVAADLEGEIVQSRELLSDIAGAAVDIFCYPNGEYSPAALAMVRRTYRAAVVTESGWNHLGTDRHRMTRLSMHDDITSDESSFLARVSGWL